MTGRPASLPDLALSRAAVDRHAERRAEEALLDTLLADPRTAVTLLVGDQLLVSQAGGSPSVALLSPSELPEHVLRAGLPLFLGDDNDDNDDDGDGDEGDEGPGRAYVALAFPRDTPEVTALAQGEQAWVTLREVGTALDDAGAGLFTTALALGAWHAAHPRCSRCGTPTDVVQAGWSRSCPNCGAEHYPRTDPAVIMAVVDEDDRILLGRQASWPEKRYSTLAGFVEPGESLEAAVRREVAEEAGVVVGDVEYRGSQPWPFPSSLMLGFRAHALTTGARADGVELAHARWWTREQFAADTASRELMLPPRVSIARRLIEDWFGKPVDDAADWARP